MSKESQNSESFIDRLVEFETKYRVEPHFLTLFKYTVEKLPNLHRFVYVEGPDEYYVKDDKFIRYRHPSFSLDNNRAEITMKIKPAEAKNNIKRKEWNWRVDNTPQDTIREGIKDLGFKFNFSIWKSCHIYNFNDATLVFYTVYDTTDDKPSKTDTFVEIEVSEEGINQGITEQQCWDIIIKYEKILEIIGLNAQKRLRKSLFEMYVRE